MIEVRDRSCTLRSDKRGIFVQTFGSRWYATVPVRWKLGSRVLVRFDVPGSDTVSVWRGDQMVGEFSRRI